MLLHFLSLTAVEVVVVTCGDNREFLVPLCFRAMKGWREGYEGTFSAKEVKEVGGGGGADAG